MSATRRWALRIWPRVVINHWLASLQFAVARASATQLTVRHPIGSLRAAVHWYLVGWLIITAIFVRAIISWFAFWEVAGNEIMTDIVGDTLVAVESGGREILARVEHQLTWCLGSVTADGPVVVVAHSQGAMLAHQVLSGLDPKLSRRVHLITVGAGIVPIHGLCDGREWWRAAGCWIALTALSLWGAFLYVVAGLVVTGHGVSLWSPVLFGGLPLVALVGARIGGTRDVFRSMPALRLGDRVGNWVDVSSWWDPVCTGPLLAGLGVVDAFAVVANGYNLFAEHGAYRRNDLVLLTIAEVMAKSRTTVPAVRDTD